MTVPRKSALATGLICLAIAATSCSGSSGDAKDTAATPTPSQAPVPFDCTKLMTEQYAEDVLKQPVEPYTPGTTPPNMCAFSAGGAVLGIEHLDEFPNHLGGYSLIFEHRKAVRVKDSESCSHYVKIGEYGNDALGVLKVFVSNVTGTDMCGIADGVAHRLLSELTH